MDLTALAEDGVLEKQHFLGIVAAIRKALGKVVKLSGNLSDFLFEVLLLSDQHLQLSLLIVLLVQFVVDVQSSTHPYCGEQVQYKQSLAAHRE